MEQGVFKKQAEKNHVHKDGDKKVAVVLGKKAGGKTGGETGDNPCSDDPWIMPEKHKGNKIGAETEINKHVHDKFKQDKRKKEGQGLQKSFHGISLFVDNKPGFQGRGNPS
jgi:hypothetical protein